jgi:hypothetical protein
VAEIVQVIKVTVGEPETGLWCDDCLLPSVVAIPVVAMCGSRILSLTVFRECADCGQVADA